MKTPLTRFTICIPTQIVTAQLAFGQALTHGPVVGGVTASEAKVFVRSDQAASVALEYGTDPALQGAAVSDTVVTDIANDFITIISLTGLTAETTYYVNVLVNGVPQFPAQPFPFFTTFPPPGSLRDFNFVVLADFGTVSALTAGVETFRSASANLRKKNSLREILTNSFVFPKPLVPMQENALS